MTITCNKEQHVVFVIKYKPRVSSNLSDQTPFHISETLIQAYYLRNKFRHNILHCLTDLNDFHFFLITTTPTRLFSIKNYSYTKCDLQNHEELAQLSAFLCDNIIICGTSHQLMNLFDFDLHSSFIRTHSFHSTHTK